MVSNPGSGKKCPRLRWDHLSKAPNPQLLPGAPQCRLPTAPLGWVKCREHISLLIILCIIVYVKNKAHLSLICICLFVKFTQILESILLDIPQKSAVLSVGFASFSSTLFPSTQLSVNMLGYSTLWKASFFGNECLWLTLLVKGVNNCLLYNCQISSLPHDCVT